MEKKRSIKGLINFLLLTSITILVLYLSLKDNFEETIHQILNLNIAWFLFGIFLFVGSVSVRSFGLYRIIKQFHKDFPFKQTLRLSFMTQFFNGITPFATGGQPFEVYYLKKNGINITDGTNIIMQNFIVYQIALVFLGGVAVLSNYVFHLFPKVGLLQNLTTLGFLINILVVVGLLILAFAKNINKKIIRFLLKVLHKIHLVKDPEKQYEKWESSIERFYTGARILVENKKLAFTNILLNVVGLCALYIIPLIVAYSMGYYHSFNGFVAIVASAYVMLIGAFVPIPGGTGGLEYSFTQFYGNFLTGSTLSAVMLIWRFITYYLGMILGACAIYIKGKKK